MDRVQGAPVLVAVSEAAERSAILSALVAAKFEVWQAADYDDAVALLHASPRRLVVLVDRPLVPLLKFAETDRRLVHHHIYIALESPGQSPDTGIAQCFPCLTLWTLTSPTPDELSRTVARAQRLLSSNPRADQELVAR